MEDLTFEQMPLSEALQSAIRDMGFTIPSPIQKEAIPYLLEKRDVIGQAQTGTGKTAAFAIPALENVDANNKNVQVMVLCPTRELALQVSQEFKKLAKYKEKVFVAAIYGGEAYEKQISQLKRGTQIVVGTPGRVIDHIQRGTLKLHEVKTFILDEADEMLNMGFKEDIESVLEELPEERQTVFFSATMPAPIMELTKKYQNKPQLVRVVNKELTSKQITQLYYSVKSEHKMELMVRLIEFHQLQTMLVFCNTKQKASEVADELTEKGYEAEAIHGDLSQGQRNNVMGKFRNSRVRILVATDVAARGIDVDNVEAVFNYDTPLDPEYYVHRIGRTGRAGKTGMSFTFVSGKDNGKLRQIEQYSKVKINKGEVPTKESIFKIRQESFAQQIKTLITEDTSDTAKYENLLNDLLNQGLDMKQIAVALLQKYAGLEDNSMDDKDLSDKASSSSSSEGKRERTSKRERIGNDSREKSRRGNRTSTDTTRVFMNLGKDQKVSKGDILGAITNEGGINGSKIGMIDVYDKYTFVDIAKGDAQKILKLTGKIKIKGKKVNFELAN
jgi:ATP-dependent RNA helicase DeaD